MSRTYKGKNVAKILEILETEGEVTFKNFASLWDKVTVALRRRYPRSSYTVEVSGIYVTFKGLIVKE